MPAKTTIEWTEATWNPVTGCTKVSLGCRRCYAERLAVRLKGMGNPSYHNGFGVSLHENLLDLPLRWRRPTSIFVNSMSDLFHEEVPEEFILRVFGVMQRSPQHRFQVLTKRSERLAEMSPRLPWAGNVWMGVTVEHAAYLSRVQHLRTTRAAVKFLSLEPLLGPLPDLDLTQIDWVIVGGESGPGSHPVAEEWVTEVRDQCLAAGVPFFFKQWGGIARKRNGRLLQGREWNETPQDGGASVRLGLSS